LKRPVFFVVGAGLLTFAVVFMLLAFSRSVAAPSQNVVAPTREPTPVVTLAADSLAPRLAANQVALGVPTSGSEALLRDVQTGDRLDVLASLPSPVDAQPLTVVVVRGATVLRAPTAGDPLLLSVSGSDAIDQVDLARDLPVVKVEHDARRHPLVQRGKVDGLRPFVDWPHQAHVAQADHQVSTDDARLGRAGR